MSLDSTTVLRSDATRMFWCDVESIGLYGEPFAFSWVVADMEGKELEHGTLSCPHETAKGLDDEREWLAKNVFPKLTHTPDCKNPQDLYQKVYEVWKRVNEQYKPLLAFADCAYPVESNFFFNMMKADESNRRFTGPYPLHELQTALSIANIERKNFPRLESELPEHNPLNDARYSLRLFSKAWKINHTLGNNK